MKSGILNLLEPSGPVKACNGIALPLPIVQEALRTPELAWTGAVNVTPIGIRSPNRSPSDWLYRLRYPSPQNVRPCWLVNSYRRSRAVVTPSSVWFSPKRAKELGQLDHQDQGTTLRRNVYKHQTTRSNIPGGLEYSFRIFTQASHFTPTSLV
jgi:hypothetical protein